MAQTALLVLLAATLSGFPTGGVVASKIGKEDRVVLVSAEGTASEQRLSIEGFASHVSSTLPVDDRGKFHIIVFSDARYPLSKQLVSDFHTVPALKALAAWGKFQVVDWGTASEADKTYFEKLNIKTIPTVFVIPTHGHQTFPFKGIFAQTGYAGDHGMLARNLYEAIRKLYEKHAPSQCPGPYCPNPGPKTPWRPPWKPKPEPKIDYPIEPMPPAPSPAPVEWLSDWKNIALVIGGVLIVLYFLKKSGYQIHVVTPNNPTGNGNKSDSSAAGK